MFPMTVQPRFSVVIPTCERHKTLYHTLRSALNQDFDDYEIVVSDNAGGPATRETVERLASPRIRYVRTPRRVAMTNNFEFGVAHSRGEYVIVIGDDDGLMPDALSSVDRIARSSGEKAIRWESTHYYWPDMLHPRKRSLASFAEGAQELQFDGETTISNVANEELHYSLLPMLYHAAIHRDLLDTLRERTGSVFKSRSPDIYSGFAVAYIAKHYLYCGQPYSIMGISGKSNGWAAILNQPTLQRDFENDNHTDGIRCHPCVPEIPGLLTAVLDCFHTAKDALFSERDDLHYEEKYFILSALAYNYRACEDDNNLRAFRRALANRPALLQWFETVAVPNLATIKAEVPRELPPSCITPTICDLNVSQAYGIEDIYELTRQYRDIVRERKALSLTTGAYQ
jgi:glycosyltransferase involved in cell wall biosynthesis